MGVAASRASVSAQSLGPPQKLGHGPRNQVLHKIRAEPP